MCELNLGDLKINLKSKTVRRKGLRIAVIGESGSGKSWTVGVLAEEALDCGIQVVIFDLHGEHTGLATAYDNVLVIGKNGDLPLSGKLAKVYREAYESGFSLVFDLSEVFVDLNKYDDIVLPIVKELWLSHIENRRSALWIVEEAQLMAPQERSREATRRVNLLKSIAMGGRKFGVMLVLATQRPAELNKGVLSQCYLRLFGRLTEMRDREAVKDYLKPISADELKKLNTGEFYVYGLREEPFLAKIKSERKTQPGGYTPEIAAARPEKSVKILESLRKKAEEILAQKGRRAEDEEHFREELRRKDEIIEELRRELEMMRNRLRELEKSRFEDSLNLRAASWLNNFEHRLRALAGSRGRAKLLKSLFAVEGNVSPEWLAAESGLSVRTVKEYVNILHSVFFVERGGIKIRLIEKGRGKRMWYRNNIEEFSRAVAALVGCSPQTVKMRILKIIYSL